MKSPKMADTIPRIKFKRQVLKFKHPRLCIKSLMASLCVLVTSICSVLTATCPSSVPSSAATTTELYTTDLYFSNLKSTIYT